MSSERVTVTLPRELMEEIDRQARNRSRFILEAVRRELDRRRRLELRRSLEKPHEDTQAVAEAGFRDWASGLPDEEASDLIDLNAGHAVRWTPEGWVEVDET